MFEFIKGVPTQESLSRDLGRRPKASQSDFMVLQVDDRSLNGSEDLD